MLTVLSMTTPIPDVYGTVAGARLDRATELAAAARAQWQLWEDRPAGPSGAHRRGATAAVEFVDLALRNLHAARTSMVTSLHEADNVAGDRVDALIAELRAKREARQASAPT